MPVDTGVVVASNVDIVNMALVKVGQATINAFSEDNDRARSASVLYFQNRNMLLRKIPWNFARKWIALTELTPSPINLDITSPGDRGTGQVVFTNAFQLLNDCIRVHRFSPKDAPWRVVGRTIYTSVSQTTVPGPLLGVQPPPGGGPDSVGVTGPPTVVGIEYIQAVTDCSLFDYLFVEALVNKMAMDMCFGQNGLEQVVAMSRDAFKEAMVEAAYVNGVENNTDPLFDTTIVDVRMGYGNTGLDFGGTGGNG